MDLQLVEEGDALRRTRRENETLYAVIKTVSSSLDLDRVLRGIVDIATDATGCHACFIYFLEGDRLVLRAASPRYSGFVGHPRPRGRRGPRRLGRADQDARVHPRERDGGPADEVRPRARGGELPVDGRGADPGEGRRRDRGRGPTHRGARASSTTTCSTSSSTPPRWSPGAIENAQLYEETRRRVSALTTLTAAEPGARRSHPARGPLRRRRPWGARAAPRGRVSDLPARYRRRRARPRGLGPRRGAGAEHETRRDGPGARPDAARQRLGRQRAPPRGQGAAAGRRRERSADGRARRPRRAARGDLLPGSRPRVHVRGRRAAGGRGPSDRGRAQEGGADRAAHRREHRQGHVRCARRGLGPGCRGEGGRGGLRPRPASHVPSRRARPQVR